MIDYDTKIKMKYAAMIDPCRCSDHSEHYQRYDDEYITAITNYSCDLIHRCKKCQKLYLIVV